MSSPALTLTRTQDRLRGRSVSCSVCSAPSSSCSPWSRPSSSSCLTQTGVFKWHWCQRACPHVVVVLRWCCVTWSISVLTFQHSSIKTCFCLCCSAGLCGALTEVQRPDFNKLSAHVCISVCLDYLDSVCVCVCVCVCLEDRVAVKRVIIINKSSVDQLQQLSTVCVVSLCQTFFFHQCVCVPVCLQCWIDQDNVSAVQSVIYTVMSLVSIPINKAHVISSSQHRRREMEFRKDQI